MRRILNVNRNEITIDDEKFKLKDIMLNFEYIGSIRSDVLFEMILDYYNRPNKISIARKLDKYKK